MSEATISAPVDVNAVVQEILSNYEDDEALLKEIAMRALGQENDPAVAGTYQPQVTFDFEHAGLADDLLAVGSRILRRVERELHAVVCGGSSDDKKDRDLILKALKGEGDIVLSVAVVGVLITGLGLSPAVAAAVGAILIRRVLQPSGDELCKIWTERLGS